MITFAFAWPDVITLFGFYCIRNGCHKKWRMGNIDNRLTGMIVAVVIFVVLIPAICSAWYQFNTKNQLVNGFTCN